MVISKNGLLMRKFGFCDRPENELLLSCARTTVEPQEAARVNSLVRKELDWSYLAQLSVRQGVMPLLYRTLKCLCAESVPRNIMQRLSEDYRANALRNLFMTRELLKLLGYFEALHIPAVPFRGPVLAVSAYGHLALRQFVDLDIAVPTGSVLQAKRAMASYGYETRLQLTRRQEWANLRYGYCDTFTRDDRIKVEIHWRMAAPYFPFGIDAERYWERLRPMPFMGKEIQSFSPEDMLLICCWHGAKHAWDRLAWICDIAELIRFQEQMDWNRIVELASDFRLNRVLYVGLSLTHAVLGAPLPDEVLYKLGKDSVVESLTRELCTRVSQYENHSVPISEMILFHLRVCDRLSDRIRYCLMRLIDVTRPRVMEYELLPLPDWLYPLYYLLRPARLAQKHGRILRDRLLGMQGNGRLVP